MTGAVRSVSSLTRLRVLSLRTGSKKQDWSSILLVAGAKDEADVQDEEVVRKAINEQQTVEVNSLRFSEKNFERLGEVQHHGKDDDAPCQQEETQEPILKSQRRPSGEVSQLLKRRKCAQLPMLDVALAVAERPQWPVTAGPVLQNQKRNRLTPRDDAFDPRTSKSEDFPLTPTNLPSTLGLYVPDAKASQTLSPNWTPADPDRIRSPSPLPVFEHPSFQALNSPQREGTCVPKLVPELSQKRDTLDLAALFVDRGPFPSSPVPVPVSPSPVPVSPSRQRVIPEVGQHGRPLSSLSRVGEREPRSEWRDSVEMLEEAASVLQRPLEKFSFNATREGASSSEDARPGDSAVLRKVVPPHHLQQIYDALVQRQVGPGGASSRGLSARTASLPSLRLAAKLRRIASRRPPSASDTRSVRRASTDRGSQDSTYETSISSTGTSWRAGGTVRQLGRLHRAQRTRAAIPHMVPEPTKAAFAASHKAKSRSTSDTAPARLNGRRAGAQAGPGWEERYFGGYAAPASQQQQQQQLPRGAKMRPGLPTGAWGPAAGQLDVNEETADEDMPSPRSAMEYARRSTPLGLMYGLLDDPLTVDSTVDSRASSGPRVPGAARGRQESSNSLYRRATQVELPHEGGSGRGEARPAEEVDALPAMHPHRPGHRDFAPWSGDAELPLSPDSAISSSSTSRESRGESMERYVTATPNTPYTPHTPHDSEYAHLRAPGGAAKAPHGSPQSAVTLRLAEADLDGYDGAACPQLDGCDFGPKSWVADLDGYDGAACPQLDGCCDFGPESWVGDLCKFPTPPASQPPSRASSRGRDEDAPSGVHALGSPSSVSSALHADESSLSHETSSVATGAREEWRLSLRSSDSHFASSASHADSFSSSMLHVSALNLGAGSATAAAAAAGWHRRAFVMSQSASCSRAACSPQLREMRLPRLFELGLSPGSPFLLSSSLSTSSDPSRPCFLAAENRRLGPAAIPRAQAPLVPRRRGYVGQRLSVQPSALDDRKLQSNRDRDRDRDRDREGESESESDARAASLQVAAGGPLPRDISESSLASLLADAPVPPSGDLDGDVAGRHDRQSTTARSRCAVPAVLAAGRAAQVDDARASPLADSTLPLAAAETGDGPTPDTPTQPQRTAAVADADASSVAALHDTRPAACSASPPQSPTPTHFASHSHSTDPTAAPRSGNSCPGPDPVRPSSSSSSSHSCFSSASSYSCASSSSFLSSSSASASASALDTRFSPSLLALAEALSGIPPAAMAPAPARTRGGGEKGAVGVLDGLAESSAGVDVEMHDDDEQEEEEGEGFRIGEAM